MAEVRVIKLNESVYSKNDNQADMTRRMLNDKKVFFVNIMSSPGSGKTTMLSRLINMLKDDYRIGEMDVDIESDIDARRVAESTGVKTMQIHNGGLCHIDAKMTADAISEYGVDDLDILFLENIGNLVCPAEFDTGAHRNVMIAREAIVNLEKEGLLKVIPQSGTYVACINCKRSEQEWFVRKSLEIGMVDAIFKNASADMLDKMAELNNRLINYDEETESIPRIEIDNEFHQLIYECSGEQLAKNIIKTQMSHYNRIRYLAELNKNISVKTNDEHNMLIDAIRNKDKRMYLRVIKAHISRIFNELDKLKGIYPEYFEKN